MAEALRVHLRKLEDHSYDIVFGTKLKDIPKQISKDFPRVKKIVITDSNVNRIYGKYFRRPEFAILVIPAGEQSKSRATKEKLENALLTLKAGRDSVIIALGGGMIGDLAGFVAATYLRGIRFIQIPTSLLAQVDSSIGGKVAVDHPIGKNLIGAFYQPKKVFIDIATLKTLPDREFRNGMAEVIKYGSILDVKLFKYLEQNRSAILKKNQNILNKIIRRCCELKAYVVEKDEKETDLRRILNFGHTIGHAVESLSKYKLGHGECVAIGMAAEVNISVGLGLISKKEAQRLISLIKQYDLPAELPSGMSVSMILNATLLDKKAKQGKVGYTLLKKIGIAKIGVVVSKNQALKFLK